MTHVNNQNPDDRNWMDIAREDAINEVRHNGQRLPFIAAAVSLLIIGGGAVFAQTNNEAPAQANEISATQSPVATPSNSVPNMTPSAVPVIPNVAPSVGKYVDDDREYDDREGRHGDDDEEDDDEEDDD